MRILVLTQKLPLPAQDGYNLRVLAYLPRLAQRHTLRLVSLDVGELPESLEPLLDGVRRLPVRTPPKTPVLALLPRLFSAAELHDQDPAVRAVVEEEVARFQPDAIWCVGWNMLPHALGTGAPVLADVIDEGAREAWLDLLARPTPRRLLQLGRTIDFERRYFRGADVCLFVADQDARITSRVARGVRAEVIHNGVDCEHYSPNGAVPAPDVLVFEGTMSHVPNVEGVRWFCKRVLPRIRAERPNVRFEIVGRDPGPRVRELTRPGSGVEVTGFVEDVRPHVLGATAFVCPLIGGAGQKNKILQAWALGKAIVATPISLGGLRARDGENLLVAEGAEALAAACLRVLSDPALAERLGRAGRETALEHYSWDRSSSALEELLARVADRGKV